MKRPGPVLRLAAPLKVLAQRFTFLGLVALSVGLMVLGKAETPLVEQLRAVVMDAFVPVLDALSRPIATVADISDKISEVMNVYTDNARLRDANERLLRWEGVARRLETENASLRGILRLTPDAPVSYVTARVVADSTGVFVRSVLVAAGAQDGVAKGQAAITGEGLVGRVGEVGGRSARILLLTDLNSEVPVTIENGQARAILAGDNSDQPKLLYLTPDAHPQVGQRVVTSGHGGVFPPGLAVGTISSTADGIVRVKPFVEFHRLDYVRLVDYGLTGTLSVSAPRPARRGSGR
jgi:rod shape-determining protein MreC